VDLRALPQVLLGGLGEVVVENDDVVPLRLFLALTRTFVPPCLRRCDAQVDDRIARRHAADLGVSTQIPNQNHLVDAACHAHSPAIRASTASSVSRGVGSYLDLRRSTVAQSSWRNAVTSDSSVWIISSSRFTRSQK